jgi:hypothetical protein
MAGEKNANSFLIYKGAAGSEALLLGQGDGTLEIAGEPIELSNKSSGNSRTFLTGSTTTKAHTFTVDVTFSSDSVFLDVVADADTATEDDYVIKTGDASGDISWAGKFIPNITSVNGPQNTAITLSMQFLSNGDVTQTIVA